MGHVGDQIDGRQSVFKDSVSRGNLVRLDLRVLSAWGLGRRQVSFSLVTVLGNGTPRVPKSY